MRRKSRPFLWLALSYLCIAGTVVLLIALDSSTSKTVGCILAGGLAVVFLGMHSWDEQRATQELIDREEEGGSA